MNRKELHIVVSVALIAGLIGGAFSAILLQAGAVTAQETKPKANIIEAEGFKVVKDGKTYAELSANENSARLRFIDARGGNRVNLRWDRTRSALDLYNLQEEATGLARIEAVTGDVKIFLSSVENEEGPSPAHYQSASLSVRRDGPSSLSIGVDGKPRATLVAE